MAARLEGLSNGSDVVISAAVYNDPEVRELLNSPANNLQATNFAIELRGFDEERFNLWRVSVAPGEDLRASGGPALQI